VSCACRYSLFVCAWKRPDTIDAHPSHANLPGPLTEQQLLPLISWVRAIAAMAPSATFLVVATHSNTPRAGESEGEYRASFASMLIDINARIKLELGRIQEAYTAELAEIQRTLEKLRAQLVAQEIKKRKLGSPCVRACLLVALRFVFVGVHANCTCRCPGTTVLSIPGIPDDVRVCNTFISELRGRIDHLTARCLRITQVLTPQGASNNVVPFQVLPTLAFDCTSGSDLIFMKDAFKNSISAFISGAHWKLESSVQFQEIISDIIAKLPAHKYSFEDCVAECHVQINQAAENYVAHSLRGAASASSASLDSLLGDLQLDAASPSSTGGVQCQVQPSGELKIFLVDCNGVTFSTHVTAKHPFVHDYLEEDPSLLAPFIQGTTGLAAPASSGSQVDVTFSSGCWTVSVVRPLKLSFKLTMEVSAKSRKPPTKLTVKDVRNITKALISLNVVFSVGGTIFPRLKLLEYMFTLLVHPQPKRLAASSIDTSSSDADFKFLEDVGIVRMQLLQHVAMFNTAGSGEYQPAIDMALALSMIRKLPSRNDAEIRFKSAARHISMPAPTVPDSAIAASNFAAALPLPFHTGVATVLSHLVFIRIIADIEIDSGAVVTSGRGRVLLQRGTNFCLLDSIASEALPPPPDKYSSFNSFISKDMYPSIMRAQSNDLSMFCYVLECVRQAILHGPLPFVFHPFCVKVNDPAAPASWIRQCIENSFYGTSVKHWAELNTVGDRVVNLHAQRCAFYVSSQPSDTSHKFVAALKGCMTEKFLCNVWDSHNSTPQPAHALAEARHFIIALTPEYLSSAACVSELLHILDLVHPSPDDPRPPVAAHARAIAANPAQRKTIALLLLHPAVSAARIASIAQV